MAVDYAIGRPLFKSVADKFVYFHFYAPQSCTKCLLLSKNIPNTCKAFIFCLIYHTNADKSTIITGSSCCFFQCHNMGINTKTDTTKETVATGAQYLIKDNADKPAPLSFRIFISMTPARAPIGLKNAPMLEPMMAE